VSKAVTGIGRGLFIVLAHFLGEVHIPQKNTSQKIRFGQPISQPKHSSGVLPNTKEC